MTAFWCAWAKEKSVAVVTFIPNEQMAALGRCVEFENVIPNIVTPHQSTALADATVVHSRRQQTVPLDDPLC